MALEKLSPGALIQALEELDGSFAHLPEFQAEVPGQDRILTVLSETAARLGDNFPYFHPLYAGQMLKPPHPLARAAYALATWINPNNHALDGGRASSAMEKEAVAELAAMFGWSQHLGHLSSGGTMANLEALWVAGQLQPGKTIAASSQAHYTHERISGVLRLPFAKVEADDHSRLDCASLERLLDQGGVGCVVATLGTTGVGAVDPLPQILKLRERYGFRLHVDAAYGGYFRLAGNLAPSARAAFELAGEADSIVIDPHKHGLQPYGCGCILFRDPAIGRLYKHESPYTYFSSHELHLGEISLECSRPGASAVALWATQRLLPPVPGGAFAQGLEASRRAALAFSSRLKEDPRFVVPFDPELDIVVWAPQAASASEASALSQKIFDLAAEQQLHLALIHLPAQIFHIAWPELKADQPTMVCLRSVLMKPEHEEWLDRIYEILGAVTDAARAA
ncbi:pyridoxal phosphate-dependent decarboxylase family protein [Paludibaculum fermentans]|uniref:pyridoxal phosphate-dependent decarboxylase family protein n=1 Tax=Paludibaculum fermentans TaxID=1473598 RepID=UPI003EBB3AD5